jgi:tetratricopeptide (TPR) repeat protein
MTMTADQEVLWETHFNETMELYGQGRYAPAVEVAQKALQVAEQAMSPTHVATGLHNLAALYEVQGQYAQAEPAYLRALAIREKVLGPDHLHVSVTLRGLARLYAATGQSARAEPLYERALAIHEKALGPDDPAVATDLVNLAALHAAAGRNAQAEPMYLRALAIRERALGADEPEVALILNNLADIYRVERQYEKAESHYRRALAIDEKTVGPDHPDVATDLDNLGVLYVDQGQYAQAEPLYERSLAMRERVLGPTHPDVARGLQNMAWLYKNTGRELEAKALEKRSAAIRGVRIEPPDEVRAGGGAPNAMVDDVSGDMENPGLPDQDLTQAAYSMMQTLEVTWLVYGPDSLAECFRAVSAVAPVFLQTQGVGLGVGSIGGRTDSFWLGFQGRHGSVLAYFCNSASWVQDHPFLLDEVVRPLGNLPDSWHWGRAVVGNMPSAAADILTGSRAVPVWDISGLEHARV